MADIGVLLDQVAQTIFDKKGCNILGLDVRGISTITDYIILAEGMVDRHVSAIAHELMQMLKEKGQPLIASEGLQNGDWVVLDYGVFMIHLFMPGLREKYRLEELYKEGKIINFNISISKTI